MSVFREVVRLGGEPELRFSQAGNAVLNFRGAITKRKQENGQWVDGETSWFNFVAFGAKAEAYNSVLSKAALVLVHGDLRVRDYETKTGEKSRSVDVTVSDLGLVIRQIVNGRGELNTFTPSGTTDEGWGVPAPENGTQEGWATNDQPF